MEIITGPDPVRSGWSVVRSEGSASAFHQMDPSQMAALTPGRPMVWIHTTDRPAIVLGSRQTPDLLGSTSRDGSNKLSELEVTVRRSGGGAVYVDPAIDCWIDLVIPSHHHRWDPDVGRSFHWVGRIWQEVLVELGRRVPEKPGLGQPVVATTPPRRFARPMVCFADVGHGEVTVGGTKIVGLSQRRQRDHARFQCLFSPTDQVARLAPWVDQHRATEAGFDGPLTVQSTNRAPRPTPTELMGRPDPSLVAEIFLERLG